MDSLLRELTDVELVWKDPISNQDMYQKTAFGGTICITNLIGAILIPPIMSFEKYGRDPQKRDLKSQVSERISYFPVCIEYLLHIWFQLYFQLAANNFIGNLVSTPILFWRHVFGPVNSFFYYYFMLLNNNYIFQIFIILSEIYSLKFLTVVILKRIPTIIDDFVARFLSMSNLAIGILLALLNCFTALFAAHELIFTGYPVFILQAQRVQLNFKYYMFLFIHLDFQIKSEKIFHLQPVFNSHWNSLTFDTYHQHLHQIVYTLEQPTCHQ